MKSDGDNGKGAEGVVQIDRQRLDKECSRLPGDYIFYAHAAAEAKCDVDEAKAELDVVEAELSRDIRKSPEDFDCEKVTEEVVKKTVVLQKRYQDALKKYHAAKHDYEMQQAVVWALEMKKRSLTLLVELHGMGYFADVKVSDVAKRAVNELKTAKRRHLNDED